MSRSAASSYAPRAQQKNFGAALFRAAHEFPQREAFITSTTRWSYEELLNRALVVGSALRARGLRTDARIGLLMESSPEFVELVAGAALVGVVPVLFNIDISAEDLIMHLTSLGVEALFVAGSKRHDLIGTVVTALASLATNPHAHFAEEAPRIRHFFSIEPTAVGFFEEYAVFTATGTRDDATVERNALSRGPASWLAVVFTSGATGTPTACGISHLNLLCKVQAFNGRFALEGDSRVWLPLPMFQIGFLMMLVNAITAGATLMTSDTFEPKETLRLLTHERVTHAFPIYATYWLPIIYMPEFMPSDLPMLSHVCLLGPRELLQRAQLALPQCVVLNIYGVVEGGGVSCMSYADDPQELRFGTAGTPFPGHELRIADPVSGTLRKTNEIGEIQMRGNGVIGEYLADSTRTGQQFLAGGWFRTGDLGSLDSAGVLRYCGRLSEILAIGDDNVPAILIETAICNHPAVAVAQVVARSDARLGEVAAAFVEVKRGAELSSRDLLAHCRHQMKETHVPRYITFVHEWPISASRIRKQALVELPLGQRLLD
jgi:acyl-CoA synthetase (AMP-forming)/AMP-acid ligase II